MSEDMLQQVKCHPRETVLKKGGQKGGRPYRGAEGAAEDAIG